VFLKTIKRLTISQLNYIYKEQTNHNELSTGLFQKEGLITDKLEIILNNEINISRIGLPALLVSFLKEELKALSVNEAVFFYSFKDWAISFKLHQ